MLSITGCVTEVNVNVSNCVEIDRNDFGTETGRNVASWHTSAPFRTILLAAARWGLWYRFGSFRYRFGTFRYTPTAGTPTAGTAAHDVRNVPKRKFRLLATHNKIDDAHSRQTSPISRAMST